MKKQRIIEIIILILLFALVISGILTYRHYKIVKPNTYTIYFSDIDSIVKGSPVRFMGINVGHVVKLKRKNDVILCRIRITKEGVKIPDMTRAKVAFNGLGGSKSIELFPPLTDEPSASGIVAVESLRINDFAGIVRNLKDVCIVINNFVQEIDPFMVSNTMKMALNPELFDKINEDTEIIINKKAKIDANFQKAMEKENTLDKAFDYLNKAASDIKSKIIKN